MEDTPGQEEDLASMLALFVSLTVLGLSPHFANTFAQLDALFFFSVFLFSFDVFFDVCI